MRLPRAFFVATIVLVLPGCGYVHFGRRPDKVFTDARIAEAVSSLKTENKILKQELALTRREGDALRSALERALAGSLGNGSPDLIARLGETSRELATLRESHARLRAERDGPAAAPERPAQLRELEAKLAASVRDQTQLQAENTRLRGEIGRAQSENASLAERLKSATASYDRAQTEIAQLNLELLAQKQARARVEQAGEALRAQLSTVMAQSPSTTLTNLQSAKAPPAEASPTVELRSSVDRLALPPTATDTPNTTAPAIPPSRRHTVEPGDTLEKLAQRYYGAPERWPAIYDANNALLGGGEPLRAGMELTIPEK